MSSYLASSQPQHQRVKSRVHSGYTSGTYRHLLIIARCGSDSSRPSLAQFSWAVRGPVTNMRVFPWLNLDAYPPPLPPKKTCPVQLPRAATVPRFTHAVHQVCQHWHGRDACASKLRDLFGLSYGDVHEIMMGCTIYH